MVTQETVLGRHEVGIVTGLWRVEKAEEWSHSDLLPLLYIIASSRRLI